MVVLNLKVKTLQHAQHEIQIDSTASVLDLKKLLTEKTQVPTEQQKLIYMGKVLKDSQTIESFGNAP